MKHVKCLIAAALAAWVLPLSAYAAGYSFLTEAPSDYYPPTAYEDTYGSQYHYGGPNVVDYQIPELTYGVLSNTQTGNMEKIRLPGLQSAVSTADEGGYGVGSGMPDIADIPGLDQFPAFTQPAYTSAEGMERPDGSLGTLKIPKLDISMKVWQGETDSSMSKGLGHYVSTSAWDGNIGVCGHNRGARYTIGSIKELEVGDTVTYNTIYGTRTYAVSIVKIISSSDWSYLQATADNRITITTCLADHPESRVLVQAIEVE